MNVSRSLLFSLIIPSLFTMVLILTDAQASDAPAVFNVIERKQSDITARKQLDQLVQTMEQQQELAAFKVDQVTKNVGDFVALESLQSRFAQWGLSDYSWIQPLPAVFSDPTTSKTVIVKNTDSRLMQALQQTQALAVSSWDRARIKVVSLLGF